MKPEVSVIIPSYNTENYIYQAIDSALKQTLNNIEIIVVDDASTDGTLNVLKKFNDQRLKILANPKNIGVAGTRNRALKVAKGQWVAVLDSDDWYAPERLERLLQVAYSEDADIVADDLYFIEDGQDYPWSTLISQSGESINQVKLIEPALFVETDMYGQQGLHLGLSKPIFKRDFLISNNIEYDEILTINEDFWLALQCLVYRAKFILLPEQYYFYRSRSGSLASSVSAGVNKNLVNLELTCQKIQDFMKLKDIINCHPNLAQALSKKLKISQKYLDYYRVVTALKKRQYLNFFRQITSNPYFFIHVIFRLPGIIKRRIQYYILGDKSTFSLAHLK
ncbi:glycosyltransferase [Tolypothrix sp. PCC 7910]|uniref:glycosyltransferase family 2 protein n=1 Tax=Tolypothrix sp. PCC 7910 TaxID=2099387 RepID=UPI0014278B8B|nr:glycosyltransferase family 2 protein [Tolypothrix sp. PCC 7910]QIR40916.1 glycosyltransferase [Tolypothrix sp. PCC 7910]